LLSKESKQHDYIRKENTIMAPLTFRNSKIVYYGPHPCENCSVLVAKMGPEWGGTAFTYPSGPVYPNTEWHPHVCDPFEVRNKQGLEAREEVLKKWPDAHTLKISELGFIILGYTDDHRDLDSWNFPVAISHNCSFYDTELAAWRGAWERELKRHPTWNPHRFTGATRDTIEHNMTVDAARFNGATAA
jgi:hypothetical protein